MTLQEGLRATLKTTAAGGSAGGRRLPEEPGSPAARGPSCFLSPGDHRHSAGPEDTGELWGASAGAPVVDGAPEWEGTQSGVGGGGPWTRAWLQTGEEPGDGAAVSSSFRPSRRRTQRSRASGDSWEQNFSLLQTLRLIRSSAARCRFWTGPPAVGAAFLFGPRATSFWRGSEGVRLRGEAQRRRWRTHLGLDLQLLHRAGSEEVPQPPVLLLQLQKLLLPLQQDVLQLSRRRGSGRARRTWAQNLGSEPWGIEANLLVPLQLRLQLLLPPPASRGRRQEPAAPWQEEAQVT